MPQLFILAALSLPTFTTTKRSVGQIAKSNLSSNEVGNILLVWVPGKKFQIPLLPHLSVPDTHYFTHYHWTGSLFAVLIWGSFFYLPSSSSQLDFLECLYLAWGTFFLYFGRLLPGCCSQIILHLETCLGLKLVWCCHISIQTGVLIFFLIVFPFPPSSSHLLFSQCVVYSKLMVKSKA